MIRKYHHVLHLSNSLTASLEPILRNMQMQPALLQKGWGKEKVPRFSDLKRERESQPSRAPFSTDNCAEITYVCLLIIILQGSGILFIHQCFSKSLQICMYCTVHTYNSWFNCLSCLSFIITRFHSVPQERAVLIQHHTKPHRYIAARTYYLSIIAPVCHRW